MTAEADLPQCAVCHPDLDLSLESNPVALCPEHSADAPIGERAIKRDPSILDRWIREQRKEVQRARA